MLIRTFLLTGVIFLSSQSISQVVWRLAAGIYVLACCAAVGFFGFFAGAQAYSARFSGTGGWLPQFHWPVEFSPGLIANARQGLCAWGVVCDRLAQGPLALTGSYWLQLSIIVGAIAVAIRMRPPLARVGALFAVLWIVLLVAWSSANLGIISAFPLSPTFFFLMMYPFWAFFSLYAGVRLIEIATSRLVRMRDLPIPVGLRGPLRGGCRAHPAFPRRSLPRVQVERRSDPRRDADYASSAAGTSRCVPARKAYRGSIATLLGSPGSPLRHQLLDNAERPLQPTEFERFLEKLASRNRQQPRPARSVVAPYPDLVGVWPGPVQTPPVLLSNVLNAPADAHDLTFGLPRLANIDILRAMGVRFIITDLQLRANRARMTQVFPLSGGIALYLYELSGPNVAGFSP